MGIKAVEKKTCVRHSPSLLAYPSHGPFPTGKPTVEKTWALKLVVVVGGVADLSPHPTPEMLSVTIMNNHCLSGRALSPHLSIILKKAQEVDPAPYLAQGSCFDYFA